MIRTIIILLCMALSVIADEASWPGLKFAEVRAFAWPDDKSTEAVILKNMILKPGAINPGGAILSPDQTKVVIKAITGKRPKYPVAACHIPHNAFVFYDSTKRPVAFIEICFGCSNHRIVPNGASESIDLVALAAIFDAHKLPMGEYRDLTAFKKGFDATLRLYNESAEPDDAEPSH